MIVIKPVIRLVLGLGLIVTVSTVRPNWKDPEANWKEAKKNHLSAVHSAPLTGEDVDYFANALQNERDFKKHLDNILIPRVPDTEGNRIVREYIANSLRRLGWDVDISSSLQDTPIGQKNFHNIIATLNPDAPRRLVLACHYDSLMTPKGFLGATDSAVPCAQILNLAYTMRMDLEENKRQQNDLTLQLIFFDGEEAFVKWEGTDNTYGARDLAARLEKAPYEYNGIRGNHLDRIDVFVLLDLIGAPGPTFMALHRSTVGWFQKLADIERALQGSRSLKSRRNQWMFANVKEKSYFGGGIEDDHIPFLKRGVPILHLICVPFPDVWHKAGDNKSVVDFKNVADLNKIFRVFVAEYLQMTQ